MKRQFRPFVLLACLTAASAFGAQIAAADTGSGVAEHSAKCGEQRGHHKEMRHHFLKKLAKELGLSEQQQSQAKVILEKSRQENKPYLKAVLAQRHEMRALYLSGKADETAIRAQSAKVAAAEADLAVQRGQEAKQLLALLTPDQVTKLKGIMDKREQRFQKFMSGDQPPME